MYRNIVTKVLSRVPVFQGLTEEAIASLADMAKFNQYTEGSTVFKEGDPGDRLYVIASGNVDIYAGKGGSDEVKIKTLGVAEVFGEMALLDGMPRSATVIVAEKTILFYISRSDFHHFLVSNPEVSLKLIETISRRLRDTNKKLLDIANENELLRSSFQDSYAPADSEPPEESTCGKLVEEDYTCPCCGLPVKSLNVKEDTAEPVRSDSDLCPYYQDLNPLFYQVIICPGCGYAFPNDGPAELSQMAKSAVRQRRARLAPPPATDGPRSRDQAIQIFSYSLDLNDRQEINPLVPAGLCLKLAWFYRYGEDSENEKKYLLAALERYIRAFEQKNFDHHSQEIHTIYMIGQAHLRTGKPREAVKWFARAAQHQHKARAPHLAELAREHWQEIMQEAKKKNNG